VRVSLCMLIFGLLVVATLPARAALVLYEPFAYPVGDSLDGTDGTSINFGGKTAPNGSKWFPAGYNTQTIYNELDGTQIVGLNLGVAGLKAPVGNAAWYGGGGYSTRLDMGFINSINVYSSFAFRIFDITGVPSTGAIVAALNNTPGPQGNAPTVLYNSVRLRPTPDATDNPANYNIGLSKTAAATGVVWDSAVYTASAEAPVQFAVSRYTFSPESNTDDVSTLYLNPASSTFGGTAPTTGTILSTSTGADIGQIATFLLRQGTQAASPQGIIFDELRIGTTWADVTPPQPTSGGAAAGPMPGGPVATSSLADFQSFTYFDSQGNVMPYRLFVPPDYDPNRKYPIVVWLHGAGEVGTNNTGPASHVSAHRLASRAKNPAYSSLVLVPQTYDFWGERAQSSVLDILALLENQYSIDTNREYLTGISAGGIGVWDFIANHPDKFAAAVPVAGYGDPNTVENFKNMPIWVFHSLADEVLPAIYSQIMVDALRAAGGHPLYTEYPFGTHGSSFNDTYSEPQLFQWLYAQALPEPGTAALSSIFLMALTLRPPRQRRR
jgi:acetyl esterase/lipase